MAASGASLGDAFPKFATKGDKKECTTKDITRWCTDAGVFGKTCSSNNLDIAISKCKVKGKTTITMKEMTPLINELAKSYCKDKKIEEAAAKTELTEKLACCEPKGHGTTKTSKTGGVGKMTDASQYTGAHKERFDADGKGKGAKGREDKAENTGYVGNYKGEGTHASKK